MKDDPCGCSCAAPPDLAALRKHAGRFARFESGAIGETVALDDGSTRPTLAALIAAIGAPVQATGPAPWLGWEPVSEDPAVQALVAFSATAGAPLLLRPGQRAYIDVGPGGHFAFSQLQRAVALAASWGYDDAVRIRLMPGEHSLTTPIRAAPGRLTVIEGWRGTDGKLWSERTIQSLSIAPGGVAPDGGSGLQKTIITATLSSVEGIAPGQTIRLACDEWAASSRTLDQIEATDSCAGVFRVESVDAAARRIVVFGRDHRTAFPIQPVPAASHKCLVAHSWVKAAAAFLDGAFIAGDTTRTAPRGDFRLSLALDMWDAPGRSVGVLIHYGSALGSEPYELWVHGAERSGVWAIAGTIFVQGLCASGNGINLAGQEGHLIGAFQARLTQARNFAAVSSLYGFFVGSLGHFHGGYAGVYCDQTRMSVPYARSHGGAYAISCTGGGVTVQGNATPGRSYLDGSRGCATITGEGAPGSANVKITEETAFRNANVVVRGGGLVIGPNAAELTGVTRGRVGASGGWIETVDAMSAADLDVTYFVHAVSGSDDAGDGSAAAPFATIRNAIRMAPAGCALTIHLLSDYASAGRTAEAVVNRSLRMIRIQGSNAAGARILRRWDFANHDHGDGTYSIGGIVLSELRAPPIMSYDNLVLAFPAPPATGNPNAYNALVGRDLHALGPAVASVRLLRCEIQRGAGATAWIVGASRGFVDLDVTSTTFPAAQAGRWIEGAGAAGAAPPAWARLRGLATV